MKKKLTKVEKAILSLAQHMEMCPYNDYKVVEHIVYVLGYIKNNKKEKKT